MAQLVPLGDDHLRQNQLVHDALGAAGAIAVPCEVASGHAFVGLQYNPRLDTLRAFAAIAVLGFHYSGWIGWGWVGVPFFFVLSGYLITSILLENKARTPRFGQFCANFLRRRVLRLVPVYVLFLAGCAAFSVLTRGLSAVPSDLPYLLTYTFNFRLLDDIQRPYGHLWSLSVEWQFYLLWPVAVWTVSEATLRRILIALVFLTPLLRLASVEWFQLHHYVFTDAAQFTYLMTWTHLDSLALGALLAWPVARELASSRRVILVAAIVVFGAGLMVSLLEWHWGFASRREELISLGYPYGLFYFREYVWGYSLLHLFFATVVATAASSNTLAGIFRWRWLTYLGKVSYGFYLFHYAAILVTASLLARISQLLGAPPFRIPLERLTPFLGLVLFLGFVLSAAFAFLLAHLSYQFWERRFLKLISQPSH
jgi:peptidoglycan/LPS O-acetylase OafA/YrhL